MDVPVHTATSAPSWLATGTAITERHSDGTVVLWTEQRLLSHEGPTHEIHVSLLKTQTRADP
jgi:hypothetical protein